MTSTGTRILTIALVVMLAFSLTVGAGTAGAQSLASDGSDDPDGLVGGLAETTSEVTDKLDATAGSEEEATAETADTDGEPDGDDGDGAGEDAEDTEDAESDEGAEETPDETDGVDDGGPDDSQTEDVSDDGDEANESVLSTTKRVVDDTVENVTNETAGNEVSNDTGAASDGEPSPASDASNGTEAANVTNDTAATGPTNETATQTTDDTDETDESDEGDGDAATATRDPVGGLTGTAADAVGTAGNATGATVDTANETAGGATDGTASTVERTGEDVTDATGDVESATREGVDAVAGDSALGNLTRTLVNDTVATSDRVVANGTETAVRVVATTDAAREDLTAVAEETVAAVERTVDATTDGVDRTVGGVTSSVDPGPGGATAVGGTYPASGASTPDEQLQPDETTSAGAEPAVDRDVDVTLPGERDGVAPAADGDDEAATASGGDGGGLEGVDPEGGGALLGALFVSGALAATRTGLAASTAGGAGAATLPQLALAMLREWLFRLAVLAGYSRYEFDDPLENENRATVFETVEESPGINLSSVVEATGLSESTVRYHLRVLEHEGLVEAAKVRGRRRYVPQGGGDVELVAALEEEATKEVLEALLAEEPATGATLADALDRDKSTVSYHLSRLDEAGLVEREPDGPALLNSLCPDVRQALQPVEVGASVQQHVRADD